MNLQCFACSALFNTFSASSGHKIFWTTQNLKQMHVRFHPADIYSNTSKPPVVHYDRRLFMMKVSGGQLLDRCERQLVCMTNFDHFVHDAFKSSPEPSLFILQCNVGIRRIRHTMTLKQNDLFLERLKIEWRLVGSVNCRHPFKRIKWLRSELPKIFQI